jgi:hypothetical protein
MSSDSSPPVQTDQHQAAEKPSIGTEGNSVTAAEGAPDLKIRVDGAALQRVAEAFVAANRGFAEIARSIAPMVAAWSEVAVRAGAGLVAALENARTNAEALFGDAENIGRLGWTFPMNATFSECRAILDAGTDATAVRAAFERFYLEENGAALEALWTDVIRSPVLETWRPMLVQTRAAFSAELFLPCVTGLLAVMDGVAHRAWDREFYKKKVRDRFFESKMNADIDVTTKYLWRSTRAFVDSVFAYADFANDTPPVTFNRHWILHGMALPSGDRMDCVRVLQAIHSFENLIAEPGLG